MSSLATKKQKIKTIKDEMSIFCLPPEILEIILEFAGEKNISFLLSLFSTCSLFNTIVKSRLIHWVSPLQWNCAFSIEERDEDILQTIKEREDLISVFPDLPVLPILPSNVLSCRRTGMKYHEIRFLRNDDIKAFYIPKTLPMEKLDFEHCDNLKLLWASAKLIEIEYCKNITNIGTTINAEELALTGLLNLKELKVCENTRVFELYSTPFTGLITTQTKLDSFVFYDVCGFYVSNLPDSEVVTLCGGLCTWTRENCNGINKIKNMIISCDNFGESLNHVQSIEVLAIGLPIYEHASYEYFLHENSIEQVKQKRRLDSFIYSRHCQKLFTLLCERKYAIEDLKSVPIISLKETVLSFHGKTQLSEMVQTTMPYFQLRVIKHWNTTRGPQDGTSFQTNQNPLSCLFPSLNQNERLVSKWISNLQNQMEKEEHQKIPVIHFCLWKDRKNRFWLSILSRKNTATETIQTLHSDNDLPKDIFNVVSTTNKDRPPDIAILWYDKMDDMYCYFRSYRYQCK